ncbi:FAD binding domain-containing protein [Coprinopsis marcescibilis]|uniref:FAD binding domain-containing protein n=1 Tax=Coprinopsis marcescibilis TaxID=230819 RepID=A0A5C3L4J7_COPMA|nr:FAD binding domain-containing protein [Coprinopsis marcescibilis]
MPVAVRALNQPDLNAEWQRLEREVEGRLHKASPFAAPCFEDFESPECLDVRKNYIEELHRTDKTGAYIQSQWETCQATQVQCLLDHTNPNNLDATFGQNCGQGSVSDYFVDVQNENDVKAAFKFSRRNAIPIVIRNTGHDYKGRSSAPGSLGLWTHNLKSISYNPEFVPNGCKGVTPRQGVTMGAGVQWGQAYPFAQANNITLVGGSDKAVGSVGGWLQGGGHGPLSNTMGLGVDRVLEYKVVTPDGKYRVANECQNEDLFWALRGGGGGTFGVVLEATMLASPTVKLQTVILTFQVPNITRTTEAWEILTDNGLKWAEDGWGGYGISSAIILINPVLSPAEAAKSIAPLVEFGERIKAEGTGTVRLIVTEFPSFAAFFAAFTNDFVASVGKPLALASRLVNKDNFRTPEKRKELVSAMLAADAATPGLIMLISAPASVPSTGQTSVTEAWRDSLYHVTVIAPWNWNTTKEEISGQYKKASESIDSLRRITPDAAYVNESDVLEPNFEVSFWGEHYPRLLRLKKKYDPEQLLDCWHCVGWKRSSPRFSCYL